MGIRIHSMISNTKQILKLHSSLNKNHQNSVPKGHIPVYVGHNKDMKRYVVPLSFLNHPSFLDLLRRSEEEFGFDHPMGGLTIPCSEESFINLTILLQS
ncbi:auxin-responsive protein SAUR21-like [Silene latifolia]|uniref:auxin-responsive protein SAUR21-like n=1 Tax=Silene latifolia TaxID=37657 RepID=UPI003D7829D8